MTKEEKNKILNKYSYLQRKVDKELKAKMKFGDYISDPKFFFDRIRNNLYFALVRFGDKDIRTHLMNEYFRGVPDEIRTEEYKSALEYKGKDYYIGLLFQNFETSFEWFNIPYKMINQDKKYLVSSHLFYGINRYILADELFNLVNMDIKINWVAPLLLREGKKLPSFINKYFFIPHDIWLKKNKKNSEIEKEILDYMCSVENEVFFVSARSFAKIVIHKAWMINKRNFYLDIGTGLHALWYPPIVGNEKWEKAHGVGGEYYKRRKIWESYTKEI